MQSRLSRWLRDDAGVAMVTVVGVATILFLLLTTLLVLTNYRTVQAAHYNDRTKAMQLADAGLNYYLYRLSVDYNYYNTTPKPTPTVTTPEGSWTASATYDTTTKLITIRSVGELPNGIDRTVVARCSPPPPPMYAVGSGGNIDVGANTTIDGPLRSNGYVHISTGGTAGIITGLAQSGVSPNGDFTPKVGGVPDPNRFKGGAQYYPPISFDQMSTDVSKMKNVAGILLPSSRADGKTPSALGYEITLSDNQVIVKRVLAESRAYSTAADRAKLGSLTTTVPPSVTATMSIPANGVIFVDGDNVWVKGTYTARVTICAGRSSSSDKTYGNISVTDSVLCGNKSNATIVCGLMAQNNVFLMDWYHTNQMDYTLRVEAALLAQFGQIGDKGTQTSSFPLPTSNDGTYPRHDLELAGSALGCTGVGFQTQYFITRDYGFDDRLKTNPPPYWPRGDNAWVLVTSWLEN